MYNKNLLLTYCTTIEHKDCCSAICAMHGVSKEEHDSIMKEIATHVIAIEVENISSEG